ncbi:MAG: hypothetical protein ACRETD_04390 [Steroidobacteraceae bacterium]
MSRVRGRWLACLLLLSAPLAARDVTPLVLARGDRVGVISLLDAEITHFHSAKSIKDGFLKTQTVDWSIDAMLTDALKDRAAQMGLILVPLAVTDELDRSRESCFLNGNFSKKLPKGCVLPFEHLGNAERVQAVIVLGPGLNDSTHGGSSRRKELPEYLRGWGFATGEAASPDGKPALFSMTELLLVAPSPGGPVLHAREWGGNDSVEWSNFIAPQDLKQIPPQDFSQLQPLFASLLSGQSARLLDQVQVGP